MRPIPVMKLQILKSADDENNENDEVRGCGSAVVSVQVLNCCRLLTSYRKGAKGACQSPTPPPPAIKC